MPKTQRSPLNIKWLCDDKLGDRNSAFIISSYIHIMQLSIFTFTTFFYLHEGHLQLICKLPFNKNSHNTHGQKSQAIWLPCHVTGQGGHSEVSATQGIHWPWPTKSKQGTWGSMGTPNESEKLVHQKQWHWAGWVIYRHLQVMVLKKGMNTHNI